MKIQIISGIVLICAQLSYAQEVHSVSVSINQPETCEVILGVNLDASDTSFEIFPIPAQTHLTVSSNDILDDIRLSDLHGKEIHSFKPYSTIHQISVSGIPKGIYLLKLRSGKKTHQYKILIGK